MPRQPISRDFQPSDNQLTALMCFQDKEYRNTLQACAAAGISRQAYYHWFCDNRFAAWWLGESVKWAARQAPRVYAALARSAGGEEVGGNPSDRRTYLERFDRGFMPQHRAVNEVQIEAVDRKIARCISLADELDAEADSEATELDDSDGEANKGD